MITSTCVPTPGMNNVKWLEKHDTFVNICRHVKSTDTVFIGDSIFANFHRENHNNEYPDSG